MMGEIVTYNADKIVAAFEKCRREDEYRFREFQWETARTEARTRAILIEQGRAKVRTVNLTRMQLTKL